MAAGVQQFPGRPGQVPGCLVEPLPVPSTCPASVVLPPSPQDWGSWVDMMDINGSCLSLPVRTMSSTELSVTMDWLPPNTAGSSKTGV